MDKEIETKESVETELDDEHEQILIQCSTPPDTTIKLAKRFWSKRHVGGALAVVLLAIGLTVVIVAIKEHRKLTGKSAVASEKSFESGVRPSSLSSSHPSEITRIPPSDSPVDGPSVAPSSVPTQSVFAMPSQMPSLAPSEAFSSPTSTPTGIAIVTLTDPSTNQPTPGPTTKPVSLPTTPASIVKFTAQITTLCVIGDVPYTNQQAKDLKRQIMELPKDCEFLVHVGDLRYAGTNRPCRRNDYSSVASTLQLSHAPVFVLLGDNDYNDCPNPDEGLALVSSKNITISLNI